MTKYKSLKTLTAPVVFVQANDFEHYGDANHFGIERQAGEDKNQFEFPANACGTNKRVVSWTIIM